MVTMAMRFDIRGDNWRDTMNNLNSNDMFAVYTAAEKRVNNKTASNEDKVVVNLWHTQRRMAAEKVELKKTLDATQKRAAAQYSTIDNLETRLAVATGEYQKGYFAVDEKVVDAE